MVGGRGNYEEAVRRAGCEGVNPDGNRRPFSMTRLVRTYTWYPLRGVRSSDSCRIPYLSRRRAFDFLLLAGPLVHRVPSTHFFMTVGLPCGPASIPPQGFHDTRRPLRPLRSFVGCRTPGTDPVLLDIGPIHPLDFVPVLAGHPASIDGWAGTEPPSDTHVGCPRPTCWQRSSVPRAMFHATPCCKRQGLRGVNGCAGTRIAHGLRWAEYVAWSFFPEGVVQIESFSCHALPACEVRDCDTRCECERCSIGTAVGVSHPCSQSVSSDSRSPNPHSKHVLDFFLYGFTTLQRSALIPGAGNPHECALWSFLAQSVVVPNPFRMPPLDVSLPIGWPTGGVDRAGQPCAVFTPWIQNYRRPTAQMRAFLLGEVEVSGTT